jgi:hypothetical protein
MPIRRWATYSVKDHTFKNPFVSDVLLYDKLVIPVPPDEPGEWDRWREEGWNPGWQRSCLDIIGDLAEEVPWTQWRRSTFHGQWEVAQAVQRDPYEMTAMFLGQNAIAEITQDVLVRPVVAYRSEQELQFQADVQGGPLERVDSLAIAFQHRFLAPDSSDIKDPIELLRRAVDLAKDSDFRKARSRLYDWQENIIARGYSEPQGVEEMAELLDKYEEAMRRAKWKTALRYGIFVAGISTPIARELGVIAATVALGSEATIKVVEFIRGGAEAGMPTELAPAAMLYTARKELKLRAPGSRGEGHGA